MTLPLKFYAPKRRTRMSENLPNYFYLAASIFLTIGTIINILRN